MIEIIEETFVITDDKQADWALKRIAEETKDAERLIALADAEIEELQERKRRIADSLDYNTAGLKAKLNAYFDTVDHKQTKTQESYKLLNGTLVFKKPAQKITKNDDELIKALDGTEYVENVKKLCWGEYKKTLHIVDGNVIDDDGAIVEGCAIEESAGEFMIKF